MANGEWGRRAPRLRRGFPFATHHSRREAANVMNAPLKKQHLIDPEICIRCNTCEETCPIDAVTHDDNNYVVDVEICNYCMDCISPCPTGAIDNWRLVAQPYTLEEQFSWEELPPQADIADDAAVSGAIEALEDEVGALLE